MTNASTFPWPGSCQGAVSLTFDDGDPTQLEMALPTLQQHHLQATFYISPSGDDWRQRLAPWREVALAGHELGNHTVQHICSRNLSGEGSRGLEGLALHEIEADVLAAEWRLRELVPEQTTRTFCYPCYQSYVGEGLSQQSYVPVIARHFPAARGLGEVPNHPARADLHYLSSWPVGGWMSSAQLVRLAEVAAERGRWVILTFHALQRGPRTDWVPGSCYHEPPLPVASLGELCASLDAQRERIWVAPVIAIAQRIRAWRETTKGEQR